MNMTKKSKVLIVLGCACIGTFALALTACEGKPPYGGFDKEGYTVSVRYDSNGGLFGNVKNVNIVDTFPLDKAQNGIKLLEPGDPKRSENNDTNITAISRSGYFLAGWYQERNLRTNGAGEALDENGELCSVSGKPQGYSYANKWDFSKKFTVDGDDYTSDEVAMTLYAAWVPNFTFTFYAEGEEDWEVVATSSFNPVTEGKEFSVPRWEDGKDSMTYVKCFPQVTGKSFSKLYADENKTETDATVIVHTGTVDEETGTAVTNQNIYTEWTDGVWYRIYTAEQLISRSYADVRIELYADIDFTDKFWSTAWAKGDFEGVILGNGHTISNITLTQKDSTYKQQFGGLFGRITDKARIENVAFENVRYNLNSAGRTSGSSFGLFTGSMNDKAAVSGVTVSGELHIGPTIINLFDNYTVGLIAGNGINKGISYGNVALKLDPEEDYKGNKTYPYTATAGANGIVTIKENEDPTQDPNI